MVSVRESIRIERPVEEVYAFLDEPVNHEIVTPSLAEARTLDELDNGGKRVEHTYRMAGVGLSGELVEVEHEANKRLHFELAGDLEGEIIIETNDAGEGETELTYRAEYEIPGRVLSTVAGPFVRRYNERELTSVLENTKAHLEGEE